MDSASGPRPSGEEGRATTLALWGVIALGVLIRVLAMGGPGFASDVGTFMAWAERLASVGPPGFYDPGYFSDYPPAFLYVLWALGAAFDGEALRLAVKAVSIPADVAIALLLAGLVRRYATPRAAVLAAGLWMLQPAPIFAGPYWGQVDAWGALALLGAALAAGERRWNLAGILAVTALLVKPQFGIAVGVVGAGALAELARTGAWRPLVATLLGGAAAWVVFAVPFRMTPAQFVALVDGAAQNYPYTSLYAFNAWSIVGDFWQSDAPYFPYAAALLALGLLAAVVPLWWRRDTAAFLAAAGFAAMAFYFLPTRAHERYLFPALVLLLPFAVTRGRVLAPYLVLALTFFATLYFAFTRYPQNGVESPALLEATLFTRPGQIGLAILLMLAAAWIVWRLIRGDLRLAPTFAPPLPARAPSPSPWRLPDALRPGGLPTRRDLILALLVAVTVLATRGYRLDFPQEMYFDEQYHARTAFELIAQRPPYEWTHPMLAKQIMALGILGFGHDRVVASETYSRPDRIVALAVTNGGGRALALADGRVILRARDGGEREIGRLQGEPRALAVDDRWVYVLGEGIVHQLDVAGVAAARELALPFETGIALIVSADRPIVAGPDGVAVLAPLLEPPAEPVVAAISAVAITAKEDGTELYVLDEAGTVHVVDPVTGAVSRTFRGAPGTAIAHARGPNRLYVARADTPALDFIEVEGGRRETVSLENDRTGSVGAPARALALVPRTQFLYALAGGRVVVVETYGASPYAAIDVREDLEDPRGEGPLFLGVDGTADKLVVAGASGAALVETGRHALAWRIPGVLSGALLAFLLVLLARRLFASFAVAVFVGLAVVADGSMFAQARIAMNDVYVATFIVAGWYFVVAAHRPRRSAALDLLFAGALLGLGIASKWAAFYTLAAVGIVAIAVTARAWERGRPGTGGPLDLLAGRGRNALFLFACFFILPLGIYAAAYLPWFGGPTMPFGWDLAELTRQMYWYHSSLTSPHPAGSPWWSWPFVLKPVYWYLGAAGGGANSYLYDAGNVALYWAALPAFVWCAVVAVRARSVALGFVVFAMLAQFAAWVPIGRVLFFYHFFTALPFYLLALASALAVLWSRGLRREVAVFCAVAVGVFAYFYPFVSALPIPGNEASMFFILPTWQYDCQFYPTLVCDLSLRGSVDVVALLLRLAITASVVALAFGAFAVASGSGGVRERVRAIASGWERR